MANEHVLTSVVDHVAWLTINHPERHNAFDPETLESLATAVSRCGDDASVGAVVITGAGDTAFCAGGYLRDVATGDLGRLRSLFFGMLEGATAFMERRTPDFMQVRQAGKPS